MLHAKTLAVVTAYDIYLECVEGGLDEEWNVKETLTFWEFREKLSEQMMAYKPADRVFPGDQKMREAVAQNKRQQKLGKLKEDDRI